MKRDDVSLARYLREKKEIVPRGVDWEQCTGATQSPGTHTLPVLHPWGQQQCEEIFPPWFALTDDILSCYCWWAEASESEYPALATCLKEYKHTFNQVACDCNLPDTSPKPDYYYYYNTSHAASHTSSHSLSQDINILLQSRFVTGLVSSKIKGRSISRGYK